MARTSTAVVPLILVRRRRTEKVGDAKWNEFQRRMPTAFATSPKLVAYRACVAEKLTGKKPGSLKAAQEAFAAAAKACKAEVEKRGVPTIKKKRGVPVIFP